MLTLIRTTRVVLTLKTSCCLWHFSWENGLLAVQVGPVVIEVITEREETLYLG